MKHHYHDIRDRIPIPPKWWDENGTPRYSEFAPDETADIYADECCLLLIHCQGCGRPYHVCLSQSPMKRINLADNGQPYPTLAEIAAEGNLHYGDPPNMGCCAAGAVMNSVPIRVLEFWQRHRKRFDPATGKNVLYHDWERVPELEIDMHADWWKYPEAQA